MFSSKTKIAVSKSLYQKLAEMARRKGYATTEEFVLHVLQREVSSLEGEQTDEAIEQRLRGLGYIE